MCAGHAGAGLCWNVAPEKPAHFEVVDVQWGFMTVDANGTHIAMEVQPAHFACQGSLPQAAVHTVFLHVRKDEVAVYDTLCAVNQSRKTFSAGDR